MPRADGGHQSADGLRLTPVAECISSEQAESIQNSHEEGDSTLEQTFDPFRPSNMSGTLSTREDQIIAQSLDFKQIPSPHDLGLSVDEMFEVQPTVDAILQGDFHRVF